MNRPVGPHESPGSLHKRDEEPGQVAAEDEGAYLLSCVNSIGDVGDWPLRVGDGDRGLGVWRGWSSVGFASVAGVASVVSHDAMCVGQSHAAGREAICVVGHEGVAVCTKSGAIREYEWAGVSACSTAWNICVDVTMTVNGVSAVQRWVGLCARGSGERG